MPSYTEPVAAHVTLRLIAIQAARKCVKKLRLLRLLRLLLGAIATTAVVACPRSSTARTTLVDTPTTARARTPCPRTTTTATLVPAPPATRVPAYQTSRLASSRPRTRRCRRICTSPTPFINTGLPTTCNPHLSLPSLPVSPPVGPVAPLTHPRCRVTDNSLSSSSSMATTTPHPEPRFSLALLVTPSTCRPSTTNQKAPLFSDYPSARAPKVTLTCPPSRTASCTTPNFPRSSARHLTKDTRDIRSHASS